MMANRFNNIIDGERLIIHLHRTLDDAFGKTDINAAVINNAVSQDSLMMPPCKSRTLPLGTGLGDEEMTSTGIFKPGHDVNLIA